MSASEPTDRDHAAAPRPDSAADEGSRDGSAAEDAPGEHAAPPRGETESPSAGTEGGARTAADLLPSPVFVLLLGIAGLAGWFSWTRAEVGWTGDDSTVYLPFVFILAGWVVSVCLHEFGHAALAYRFGDRALRGGGYLRLNPFRFSELFSSLLMPAAFLLLGGIGLTGPATYLDPDAVPSRSRRSLIAAAGIAVNLVLAAAAAAAVAVLVPAGMFTDNWMLGGLMYLCYLNLTAALLNMLPLPGLDGFGVLAPYLPGSAAQTARRWGVFGVIAVFAVLWVPQVNVAVPGLMTDLFAAVGLVQMDVGFGEVLLRFWAS
ncbi:site-2 protease family protein [Streptomonospora litoralis]|uniref:Peptidase family M50 n=1 Tax=Streptomonospora litoralis TaxID=2498135 RepID=A0A4V0ZJ82_9ACTN|nr:site-2 protease family protein [Streptomonospora litoralis]QBI52572.1 Peptidase family M50 [Streptomonospora litoralis]